MLAVIVSKNLSSLTPVVQHPDDNHDGEEDVEAEGNTEERKGERGRLAAKKAVG